MKKLVSAQSMIERDAIVARLKSEGIEVVTPPRDMSRKVLRGEDVPVGELILVEYRYGDRHVLEIFLDTPRGYDDLSELVHGLRRGRRSCHDRIRVAV